MSLSKNIYKYLNSNIFASLLVGITVFLLVLLFDVFGMFDKIELKVFDFKMTNSASTLEPDSSIVLVAIDQKSLEFFEENAVSWPWPREFYGVMLQYLQKAGAKAVFFDIDFSASEIERLEVNAEESINSFADAIDSSGNVVIAVSLNDVSESRNPNKILPKHLIDKTFNHSDIKQYNNAITPLLPFQKKAKRLGVVNIETDKDGIVRKVPSFYAINEKVLPSASLALYSLLENIEMDKLKEVEENLLLDSENRFIINWYGEGGPDNTFPYYSIHSLIVSAAKINEDIAPDLPLDLFKGKTVIIGGTAFGLLDYRPVPVSSESYYPGMEIHATVLSNLLKNHFIIQPASWIKYIIILFLSFLSPIYLLKHPKILSSIIIISFFVLFLYGINYYLFYKFRIDMVLVAPELALIFSFMLTGYINYVREGRHKNEIKKIFSRYISPEVVNELLKNYEDVELGGKEVEATVFFSDIKNFTTISESLTPKVLVKHLNNYLTLASGVILEHKAMLDKYIGDAIMAIFGVPIKVENHALTACLAALQIQQLLKKDYEENAQPNDPYFSTRIGLNTGKMIVGNIGSIARTDYTAIGDSVNIASRLEGINKIYGTQIIISESTYKLVKNDMVLRELDQLRVKGKQLPLKIYELIGKRGDETKEVLEKIELFKNGIENYSIQNWVEAKKYFNDVLKIDEHDGPSIMYIDRCNNLETKELPSNWDGIFNAETK